MTGALSLLSGVLLGSLSADVPGSVWMLVALVVLAAGSVSSLRHLRGARAAMWLLAGLLLSGDHAREWRTSLLPVDSPDARVLVEGRIVGVPEREGVSLRFVLETRSLRGVSTPDSRPRRVRVSWREPPSEPRAGEQWRLLLRLLPLTDTHNFEGADPARFAFRDSIHASARVLATPMNSLVALAPVSVDTMRARIALRVRDAIADPDAAALVTALAVGITGGMSAGQWRVFNATGTTHLVAISGLHVTLFAWLAFRLARVAWRGLPPSVGRETFAGVVALMAAGAYSLLAGFSIPTQRTWIMLATFVFAKLAARHTGADRLWSVALILVLLLDAGAPLDAGFWLSFIAVGVLLWVAGMEPASGSRKAVLALKLQFAIGFALAPASLVVFGGVSLVGLAVNLVAIPAVSLVFVPVVLAGALAAVVAPPWDAPCFGLAAWLYEACWPWLTAAAEADHAVWRVAPPGWWYLMAVPAGLLCLSRAPWPLRLTAACLLAPLWWPPATAPEAGRVRITALDAARGSSVLVRTATQTLLFDTGDTWNTRGARAMQVVAPALEARRVTRLDVLVLPFLDEDRARGAALLGDTVGVVRVVAGGGWPGSGMPATRCRDTQWRVDGVWFALHAAGGGCVLRVATAGSSALFLPGLDSAAEAALLARLRPGRLASDAVLLGAVSATGSSPQWIENVAAGGNTLVVAMGGVPGARARADVIRRWQRSASAVLDVRSLGALELELDDGVRVLARAREVRFPFHWRRPG